MKFKLFVCSTLAIFMFSQASLTFAFDASYFQSDSFQLRHRQRSVSSVLGIDTSATVQPSKVTVLSPKANDQLNLGTSYDIKWSAPNYTGSLNIILSSVDMSVAGYIAKGIPNTGSYTWNTNSALIQYDPTVSTIVKPGHYYVDFASDDYLAYGLMDEPFYLLNTGSVVPSVNLTVNGSATPAKVEQSSKATVSWNAQGATYCEGSGDSLALTDGSGYWDALKNLPLSGTKEVYANDTLNTYSTLYIGIECFGSDNLSDEALVLLPINLTPTASNLTLTAPSAGATIELGQTFNITWIQSNYTGLLDIMLVNDLGQFGYIVTDTFNTGSYTWKTSNALPLLAGATLSQATPGKYKIYLFGSTVTSQPVDWFYITSTKPLVPAVNTKPKGHIDGVDYSVIHGWAFDPDHLYTSVPVHTYFDKPAGPGGVALIYNTDFDRPDIRTAYGQKGVHGFNIPIPSTYKDGKAHVAYVYAIDGTDLTGASNALIGQITFKTSPLAVSYKDGDLFNDKGTIYVIEYGKKRGFPSFKAFGYYAYNSAKIKAADTANIPEGEVLSGTGRHPRGTLVNDAGVVYFMGAELRYPYPSEDVFKSWGNTFDMVVKANSSDVQVPVGPVAQLSSGINPVDPNYRDQQRLVDVRMIMTALELYYNDNYGYPPSVNGTPHQTQKPDGSAGVSPSRFQDYLSIYPAYPLPGGTGACGDNTSYNYTRISQHTYTMTFCFEGAVSGIAAGDHTASQAGIQ